MNKRFLAIAIAAGLAVSSNVMAEGAEIYGVAHVDVMQNSGDDSTDNTTVSSRGSRVGVKGSEDLGGGMKAVYKMEWQVDLADASGSVGSCTTTLATTYTTSCANGNLSSRNQYVGIQGGMGTVLLGRHDTPTKMVQGSFDLFVDTVADMNADSMVGADIRANNVVAYISPKMGGMQMIAAIVPGEANGATPGSNSGIADGTSISFTYEAGPLYVGVGLDGGDLIDDSTRLVATYKMDALSAGFLYTVTDTQASTTDEDETDMGLSVAYKMGDNAVKFQYIDATDNGGTAGNDETTMTLGYDMNLSARTTAYALYRAFSEADVNNMGVGIKHSF